MRLPHRLFLGIAIASSMLNLCLMADARADDTFYHAGAAKIDVTPEFPIRLCGYAARTRESEGIEQRLWARALALGGESGEPLSVLLAVDSIGVPAHVVETVAARLEKEAKVSRPHFTLCSTHTHTSPCLAHSIPNMFGADLPPDQVAHIETYTKELTDKLERAARAAIADRRPARLAWGEGKLGFAANRRTRSGPVDHAMPLLRVTDADGKLRAVWVNYACHCTTLGPETNKHCGDWAGYGAEYIDAAHPGAVTLISIGCGADANPEPRTGLELARQHGRSLAAEADRLLKSELTPISGRLTCRFKPFELPFDPPPSREEFEKRAEKQDYAGYHARKNLARLDRGETLETHLPYSVQTWTFGDQLAMVFLPGEVVVDYALRLKHDFDPKRLWVMGYSNDVPCYVPSRRILKEGGYEAEFAMIFYDHPTRLAPVVEDLIVRAAHELLPEAFRSQQQQSEFPRPRSPEEAVQSFKLPADLRIELVAAEPLVVDPVAIDWGLDGRLWVAEMRDYPTGLNEDNLHGGGRIKYLEDTDRDGRYDRATVFVDHVRLPTSVLHWGKGVIYCAAPEIVYAEDTDGDGKADRQEVLFSGFSPENTQAVVNSLMWGLDGWVHGGNSVASRPIQIAKTGKTVDISGRDFRMKPGTGEFEPVAGHAQFGRVRDDFASWFGNENSSWLFHFPLPERYIRRNLNVAPPAARVNLIRDPELDRIYPISRTLERYNDPDRANRVTAACSPEIYRARLLGGQYTGNAFVCETVHNVVRRLVLAGHGITFSADKPPEEREAEFLASSDNWFRPAQIRTGPDAALWIADMYRYVIEEPRWISTERLAMLDVRAGDDRGRIYRILPAGRTSVPVPRISGLSTPQLAARMDDPTGPLRDLVHQELLTRNDKTCSDVLRKIARNSRYAGARLQAFAALIQLGAASGEDILSALEDPNHLVRAHAIRVSESFLSKDSEVLARVQRLADDESIHVRYQVALSLGEADGPQVGETLARIALRDLNDAWMRAAVLSSASHAADEILVQLVNAPPSAARDAMIDPLIATVAAAGRKEALERILTALAPGADGPVAVWQLQAAASILDARERKQLALDTAPLRTAFSQARAAVQSQEAPEALLLASIRLLGHESDGQTADVELLAGLLTPQLPGPVQTAAIAALGHRKETGVPEAMLARWTEAPPALRSSILDVLLSRPESTRALLSAIEDRRIMPAEIDAAHREQLFKHKNAAIRDRSAKVLASVRPPSRKDVLEAYKEALTLKGSPSAGAATFTKICATCHAFRGVGHAVGPNLAALTDRSTPYLFTATLDPNAAIEAKYISYLVELTDGRSLSGIITEETASSITVLQGNAVRETVLRSDVQALRSSNLSLMPEGLEEGLTPKQVADLIAYVQSGPALLGSSTAPQENHARRDFLALGTSGLSRIIAASEVFQQPGWLGTLPLHFCRQTNGSWQVTWQSAPVPADLPRDACHPFRLAAAMGYLSQPAGSFTLHLNDRPVLEFNVAVNDASWQSADGKVRMQYMVMQNNAEDSTGVLVIDVHAGLLKPGAPAMFRVTGSSANSLRWFGVFDLHEGQTAGPDEDSPAAVAAALLSDKRTGEERQALVKRRLDQAAAIVAALTADLASDSKEEYRRIPWIWRVSIEATRAGQHQQVSKLLDLSLPRENEPLRDWQAVVIGGGIINGLSLNERWPDETLPALLGDDPGRPKRLARALELAATMADDEKVPSGTRYDALRMIALRPWQACAAQLKRYLQPGVNAELQQGAVSGLVDVRDPEAARMLLEAWEHLTASNRNFALDGLLREPDRISLLLEALAQGRIKQADLGRQREQVLLTAADAALRDRARTLLKREP